MNVNLYALPGDEARVAVATVRDDSLFVGDVIKTEPDLPTNGQVKWRVISLHGDEADAVACL